MSAASEVECAISEIHDALQLVKGLIQVAPFGNPKLLEIEDHLFDALVALGD